MRSLYDCNTTICLYRRGNNAFDRVLITLTLLLLLSACGSSGNDSGDPLDDDASPPEMPMELTGTVYSAHEIELFWQASLDDGWVMGYDIYRNGLLLTGQLDAKSYFDNTVESDREYVYTVFAVDDDGNVSAPASITLVIPAATPQPLINRDNYVELLSHVFNIYVGDIYNDPLIAMSNFTIEGRNPNGSFTDVHHCESGDFTQSLDPSSTLAGVAFVFDFDSCFENGVNYDGTLSGRNSGYAESLHFENGFSLQTHPQLKTIFSGSGTFNTSMSRNDTQHQWDAVGVSVNSTTIAGSLQLESVTTTFGYGATGGGVYKSWLNGGFNVRSDKTSGASLAVHTPVELSYECDPGAATPCTYQLPHRWAFTSGQLELIAEDGSMLLLDADTPTQETANITIRNDLGIETIQAQWSEWQPLLSFNRFSADSSDWVSAQSLAYAELDASPAIRPDNYAALLDHVLDILTGYSGLEALSAAQHFPGGSQSAETTRASGVRTDSYVCDDLGAATAHRVDNDNSIYPLDFRLDFDQCGLGEYQYDGDLRGQEIRSNGGAVGINTTNLSWVDGSGNDYTFQGQSSVQRTGSGSKTVCTWDAGRTSLHSKAETLAEGVVTGEMHFEAHGSVDSGMSALMSGYFQVTSEMTGGFEIAVDVADLEISNGTETSPENWSFIKGDITIRAYDKSVRWSSDRSSLEYRVEDSIIEITNSEGSYTIDAPWISWLSRAQPALDRLCGES